MNARQMEKAADAGVARVAVTGAGGCIGRALVARLGRTPATRVSGLFRGRSHSRVPGEGPVRVVQGDLDDRAALAHLVRGAEVVYHCAATMAKGDSALSHRVNVVGTENLASAALDAGVRRLVYVSSISVYAATRGRSTITEAVEPEREGRLNPYSRTKLEGERRLRWAMARGLECTVIRPTNVYGPGSVPWFRQWARLLERTAWVPGNVALDVVHSDDVALAMIQAAASPEAADRVFHVGHQPVLLAEFVERVGRVVGRPVRRLPPALDRGLRAAIETGYRLWTGSVMSLSLTRPVRYPHTRAGHAFGYRPAMSLDQGFAGLEGWYRARAG